jgi:hypothetical protein
MGQPDLLPNVLSDSRGDSLVIPAEAGFSQLKGVIYTERHLT